MKIKILVIFFILMLSILTLSTNISTMIKMINPTISVSRIDIITSTVNELSNELGINKYIIYAIIWQESSFRNLNIHYDINGNSIGYLQVHKNAFNYVKMINPKFRKYKYTDLIFFPKINIEVGIYYLYYIYKYWKQSKHNIWYAVSIYNGNKIKNSKYEEQVYNKYEKVIEYEKK